MEIRDITEAEVAAYQQQEFTLLPKLASQQTVAALRSAVEARMDDPGPNADELASTGRFFQEQFVYPDVAVLSDFMHHPTMAHNVARALGSNQVWAYFDHIFACEPSTPLDYYWHQDLTYWPIDGHQICSIWLALTDCKRESSALMFVKPRSESSQLYAQVAFGTNETEGDPSLPPPPQFEQHPDEYDIVSWDYEPGDAVIFSARVVHSSGGNRSTDQPRIAYSSRWFGDDALFAVRPGYQDPTLFPDDDEHLTPGAPLRSRRFPLVHDPRTQNSPTISPVI